MPRLFRWHSVRSWIARFYHTNFRRAGCSGSSVRQKYALWQWLRQVEDPTVYCDCFLVGWREGLRKIRGWRSCNYAKRTKTDHKRGDPQRHGWVDSLSRGWKPLRRKMAAMGTSGSGFLSEDVKSPWQVWSDLPERPISRHAWMSWKSWKSNWEEAVSRWGSTDHEPSNLFELALWSLDFVIFRLSVAMLLRRCKCLLSDCLVLVGLNFLDGKIIVSKPRRSNHIWSI
jgi:hypothetical protein